MQIHELTRRPLAEVDIVGPGGLLSKIGAAGKALATGGVGDALKTITPGFGQGAFGSARNLLPGSTATGGTHDLTMSDFAKRMRDVQNQAAMKQVATNLQQQWNQVSKNLAPATTPAQTTAPTQTTTPTTPAPTVDTSLGAQAQNLKANQARLAAAAAKNKRNESLQLQEAASLSQLTDWYTKKVIPQSMSSHQSEYLQRPEIKKALDDVLATQNNADQQNQAFQRLVAATSVVSQQITAQNPQARGGGGGGASATRKPLTGGADAAKTDILNKSKIKPSQHDEIVKITSSLGTVRSADSTTTNYLKALGFNVA